MLTVVPVISQWEYRRTGLHSESTWYEQDTQALQPISNVFSAAIPQGRASGGGHLAYFVSDLVDQLALLALGKSMSERREAVPYYPGMMVEILLYAKCIGVCSSRQIESRLEEDVAFRIPIREGYFRTLAMGDMVLS
jgi:hypothetical protein